MCWSRKLLRDEYGAPVVESFGGSVSFDDAVQVDAFTPPGVFDAPEGFAAQMAEAESKINQHYGRELTHHAQQMLAVNYLGSQLGFDNAVWCVVHYTSGDKKLVLNGAGDWRETNV
jgi:hypothetical protein